MEADFPKVPISSPSLGEYFKNSLNNNYIHWKVFKSTKERGKTKVLLSEYGIGYASF